MGDHKYGRGKFETDPNYIAYMEMIVSHPNYAGMPNARSLDGRINWQVSSGKTTSFYKYYLERRAWWVAKADYLGLPGQDDENDRFTVAARIINPTGYRTCRLCGEDFNVGYFYLNVSFSKKLKKDFPDLDVAKEQPIDDVIEQMNQLADNALVENYFHTHFPERLEFFTKFGISKEAFEQSRHIRSYKLSPGFMGNPPDRLDGFHDYHGSCRKENDPGRFDENMRSYNHDRRSFEWWAEGNWALADTLYNKAGPGKCSTQGCERVLDKVSPDHVGPLACGFKQLPLFSPTCQNHNSAKNRRFSLGDVQILRNYERITGESVASWQVRAHWDKYKEFVTDDSQTKAFSNSLRSLQDMYLRTLWELYNSGNSRFIATILKPEYALEEFTFENLDAGNLTFTGVSSIKKITNLRKSLAARTVRIAFEALAEYASKLIERRKMVRSDFQDNQSLISSAVQIISAMRIAGDTAWNDALHSSLSADKKEQQIASLFLLHKVPQHETDEKCRTILQDVFDQIGKSAEIDFSRYELQIDDI
ncbi:Alw26I/Eco31I/Esp3I family type II restriction endonuclease [Iodobacter arcticus]|uniref:Alw26I/Eco31I/Esp3I family type II restriction endonuclease n=1 Tax=Iodobacter arcticus TaxID=590593 RepID=A0ABW2R282_9NEIS